MKLKIAIRHFIESMNGTKANQTAQWYEKKLGTLTKLSNLDLDEITLNNLRTWRESIIKKKLSNWTSHGHIRAVRRLFKWLESENLIKSNPAKKLELPRLPEEPPKGIERKDIRKMLQHSKPNPRNHALILFLANTGARIGGIEQLSWEDICLKEQWAIVREKGQTYRRVYFDKKTRKALKRLKGKTKTGRVFISTRGTALTKTGIHQILERTGKKAGAKRFNAHSFRHAFARNLITEGANLAQVSQLLGHRDIQVTAKFYARFNDQELQKTHKRFNWLAK